METLLDTAILNFEVEHFIWALILGLASAVSLPLGSIVGLTVPLPVRVTAAMTGFGGGALLCALAIELVAPTTQGGHGGDASSAIITLVLGMLAGGVLFYVLDQVVNAHGGFLRKAASTISFFAARKGERERRILKNLSGIAVLRNVPPDDVRKLVSVVMPRTFNDGDVLFDEGERGDALYFIVTGTIALEREGHPLKNLGDGDVVGEIALLTGAPRTAGATARGRVEALTLHKKDFDRLCAEIPGLDTAARQLAQARISEIAETSELHAREASEWAQAAQRALILDAPPPSPADLRKAKEEHGGAPLAIWLGILLDGIPESFVIGATLLGILMGRHADGTLAGMGLADIMPWTLIAGLFLSNFPEALSSSVGMRTQGWGRGRVLFMWLVLMIMTGLGAGVGYAVGSSMPHDAMILIEGLAAGAMLTMIASAMIPESVHLGGSAVAGLSTLAGFLAAIAFKLLETQQQ